MASIVQRGNRYNVVYLYDAKTENENRNGKALKLWQRQSAGNLRLNIGSR